MPKTMQTPNKLQQTLLILIATVSLAIGPLCFQFFGPASYARWALAQAANDFDDGFPDRAHENIERAVTYAPELLMDADYWRLRFRMAFDGTGSSTGKAQELFDESIPRLATLEGDERETIAEVVSRLFMVYERTDLAVASLERLLPTVSYRSATANNEIAYFRSLEKRDLDTALTEINAALEMSKREVIYEGAVAKKNLSGMLDTKAWVLHGLGRNNLAIKFADESIKLAYESLPSNATFFEPDAKPSNAQVATPSVPEEDKPTETEEVDTPNADKPLASEGSDSVKKYIQMLEKLEQFGLIEPKLFRALNQLEVRNFGASMAKVKKNFPNLDMSYVRSYAKEIATLRFHRACILEDLGRIEEAQQDYEWLDRFGFVDTRKLR